MKANTRTHKGELGTVANQRALNDDLLCRSGDGFAKAAMRATKENPLTAPLHDMAWYNDGQAAARGTGNFQNENSPTGLAVAKAHPVATKGPNAWASTICVEMSRNGYRIFTTLTIPRIVPRPIQRDMLSAMDVW